MKIESIEAVPFRIPYGKTLSWATGSADHAAHVLLIITTDDGIQGYSEVIPRPTIYGESQASVCHAVKEWFAPQLIGKSPFSMQYVHSILESIPANNTVKAGVDMALFDIQSKVAGIPLYQFLGGEFPAEGIPLTWMVNLGTHEEMLEQVIGKYEEGYCSFKLKGGIDPSKDIRLVKDLRKELGNNVLLYVDANQGYTVSEASSIIKKMESHGVSIIEEPLPVESLYRRPFKKQLLSDSNVSLLGDESVFTSRDVLRELQSESIDLISIKPARSGVTETRHILSLIKQFGVGKLIGTQGETTIGTLMSAHIAVGLGILDLPAELSFFTILDYDIASQRPELKNGHLFLTNEIGSGIIIDQDRLDHYKVNL